MPIIGGPSVDALIACSSCWSFPDGENVVREKVGAPLVKNLDNFTNVLMKVNREMPWFWQGLKGIETALNYGHMKEPWRGAEKPQLEIECLEENVELTAIGLMDLYMVIIEGTSIVVQVYNKYKIKLM